MDEELRDILNEEGDEERDEDAMEEEEERDDEVMHVRAECNVIQRGESMQERLASRMRRGDIEEDVKSMHEELRSAGFSSPTLEIFSPARVNGIAQRLGAPQGLSLDLTTNDPDFLFL